MRTVHYLAGHFAAVCVRVWVWECVVRVRLAAGAHRELPAAALNRKKKLRLQSSSFVMETRRAL